MTNRIKTIRIRTAIAGLSLALLAAVMLIGLPDGVALASAKTERKCANDGAVADAANNPGLVSDCAVLLDVKKNLEGKGGIKLNWSSSLPMSRWDGIVGSGGQLKSSSNLGGSPGGPSNRVTGIFLRGDSIGPSADRLKGKIPKRLAELSELRDLVLWYNDLRGRIPKELGQLSELRRLHLQGNDLRGKIPPELGDLSKLEQLWLSGNKKLRGKLPKRLGNLSNLTSLGVGTTHLTGKIPKWLGNLSNLEELNLRQSQFTGKIPAELGELPKLKVLELQYNHFSGCVPASLRNVGKHLKRAMYKDNPERIPANELMKKWKRGEIPNPFHRLPWCDEAE